MELEASIGHLERARLSELALAQAMILPRKCRSGHDFAANLWLLMHRFLQRLLMHLFLWRLRWKRL